MRCSKCGYKNYAAERLHQELLREKETVRDLKYEIKQLKLQLDKAIEDLK